VAGVFDAAVARFFCFTWIASTHSAFPYNRRQTADDGFQSQPTTFQTQLQIGAHISSPAAPPGLGNAQTAGVVHSSGSRSKGGDTQQRKLTFCRRWQTDIEIKKA